MKKPLLLLLVFLLLLPGCKKQTPEPLDFPAPEYSIDEIFGGWYCRKSENVINLAMDDALAQNLGFKARDYVLDSPEFLALPQETQGRLRSLAAGLSNDLPVRFCRVRYPLSYLNSICSQLEELRAAGADDTRRAWWKVWQIQVSLEENLVIVYFKGVNERFDRQAQERFYEDVAETGAIAFRPVAAGQLN